MITRIHFEDHGQDFASWDIRNGVVVESRPFQTSHWAGRIVMNMPLETGGFVKLNGGLTIKYPIVRIDRNLPASEKKIELDLLGKHARGLICTSVDDVKSTLQCSYKQKSDPVLREVLAYLADHETQKTKFKMVRAHVLKLEKQ
jgi:hypothetical protein